MAPTTVFMRTQKMNEVRRPKGSSLNRSQQLKPFCKICFDTGKTEEMYDSHFVRETRDPNSRIVCPTLLALECRFCFARGHTVSKCPKLDKVKSGENVCDAPLKKQINKRKWSQPNSRGVCYDEQSCCSSNGFSLLYSDDEDDMDTVDVTDTSSEVFPCLSGSGHYISPEESGPNLTPLESGPNLTPLESVNEVSNKTYAMALMAILKTPMRNVVEFSHTSPQVGVEKITNNEGRRQKLFEVPDDASCISSVSGSSCDINVDLRKVFVRSKYSAPGSWADDSDDDE